MFNWPLIKDAPNLGNEYLEFNKNKPLSKDPNLMTPSELHTILYSWGYLISWSHNATVNNLRNHVITKSNERFGTDYTLTVDDPSLLFNKRPDQPPAEVFELDPIDDLINDPLERDI